MLAARRAKSSLKGERRSRARGLSVEFADHRNYVLGDDLRYLDWNLVGRLDRLFLKLYEEERELPVRIFLDASESMNFGTPTKFDFARQVAAAIGYVALCGFDRVAVAPFPDRAAVGGDPELAHRNALRSVRGKKSSMQFFRDLSALSASGAADLNASLKRGAMEARQSGVAIVLSDFLDPAGLPDQLRADPRARGTRPDDFRRPAPDRFRERRRDRGDLRQVPAEGLSAERGQLRPAPA